MSKQINQIPKIQKFKLQKERRLSSSRNFINSYWNVIVPPGEGGEYGTVARFCAGRLNALEMVFLFVSLLLHPYGGRM